MVGCSLMVPAEVDILAVDPYQRVAIVGPKVDGKPQFQFMVETVEASVSDWAVLPEPAFTSRLRCHDRRSNNRVAGLIVFGKIPIGVTSYTIGS